MSFLRKQESRVFLLTYGGERKDPGSSIKNVEDDKLERGVPLSFLGVQAANLQQDFLLTRAID